MSKFEGQIPSALTGAVRTLNVYLLRDGDCFGRARFTQSEFKVRRLCKSSMAKTVSIPNWTTQITPRCDRGVLSSLSGRMHRVYYWPKHSDFGSVIHISIPCPVDLGARAPIIT